MPGSTPAAPPLWRRIADELQRRIDTGVYRDGFPGELELAEEYGVSRGTIRHALRPLREAGIVSAARGRRPRISNTSAVSSYGPIYSLYETVRESGNEQRSTVLTQSIDECAAVAERLQMPVSTPFFHLARIRYAGEEALAFDDVWLPAAIAGPLIAVDFTATAVYKELRDVCGVTLHHGREEIWSVAADVEHAELLGCAVGAPLFRIQRIAYQDGHGAEYRESHILGSRFSVVRSFGEGTHGPGDRIGAGHTDSAGADDGGPRLAR